MFYDQFVFLCSGKNVTRTKACVDRGFSRTAWNKWRDGAIPNGDGLQKLADYFSVTTDYLLTGEETKKEPTSEGEREISFDEFTYAMQNESKDLTETDKQILLSMAKQLNDARKKRNGESD